MIYFEIISIYSLIPFDGTKSDYMIKNKLLFFTAKPTLSDANEFTKYYSSIAFLIFE